MFIMGGCGGGESGQAEQAAEADAPGAGGGLITGEVQETMDSGGYTYVRVRSQEHDVWAAGPITAVAVGDRISFSASMKMDDFHSDTLDRTFETIYFAPSFDPAGSQSGAGSGMTDALKRMHGGKDVMARDGGGAARSVVGREAVGEVEKAEGGVTVAEVYADKAALAGKTVKVRGVVVKFTRAVMNTNWLHLQDGTCAGQSCDLTVTTNASVAVGDLITIEGTLAVDKDFGAGYKYEVIVQGATVTTE